MMPWLWVCTTTDGLQTARNEIVLDCISGFFICDNETTSAYGYKPVYSEHLFGTT